MQGAQALAERDERLRGRVIGAAFAHHDLGFAYRWREVEVQRDEALARARLEVLEHALVARVVGHHQLEAGRGLEGFSGLVQRQDAAVVGQRMQHDDGVLAGLDHFIQVADRALANRPGERAIGPAGALVSDQEAADQVAGGEVVMAGDGDQRPVEAPGHVLDEAGLAAARRPLEHYRQPAGMALLEDRDLVAAGFVPGRFGARRRGRRAGYVQIGHRLPARTATPSWPLVGACSSSSRRGAKRKKS